MSIYDSDIEELIYFAKAYSKLGWAVQQQLDKLITDVADDINPNAVKLMKEKLGKCNLELDDCFDEYDRNAK